MKYIYLVTGPIDNSVNLIEKYRLEGYEPVLVVDGTTLRGRACGPVIFDGNWKDRWNIQEILESIETFEYMYKDKIEGEERNEINNSEEFYDYGIE